MFSFNTHEEVAIKVAEKAKSLRLGKDLSRKTLAEKSGVPESTIKHFEMTGQVGFMALLKIAFALNRLEDFEKLFDPVANISLDEVIAKPRARGRK